ncbi:flagellar basal body-associated FliL family protein [Sphingomonas hengshuiensis]|uniref:Flagellar protein FliL n=1 Tax=Sphingomonas hengshuiensis TaxID=1609977 RepID=A0A7U4J8K3_9SPHN|nr:flagellar basal body-associated FliL family protein [Sphingomonas hengshuiensis]AJP72221.1 flagellar basal body protein FliL [Sphingomonas hengshuiensis]
MSSEIAEVDAEGAPVAPPAKSKKKLIIIGAAAAAMLLGGGGGAFMMLSGGSTPEGEEAQVEAGHAKPAKAEGDHGGEGGEGEAAFFDVPPMIVNLRSPDGAARFLKLHFMLVPGPDATEEVLKEKVPLILDAYQPFLRELRPEDLAGSAAVFRIKEELLVRATAAVGDGVVKDILIQDLIQQ